MNKQNSIPEKNRNRTSMVAVRRDYMENDTILYHLAPGYKVTELPDKIEIDCPYGNYLAFVAKNGSTLSYIRHFSLKKGNHPPQEYPQLREFFERVAIADEMQIGLTK